MEETEKGRVVIYGSSDDLIEVEGKVPGCDEYNGERATFVLIGQHDDQSTVRVRYAENGCWAIEVAPLDEDIALIPCVIEMSGRGYSACATFKDVKSIVKASDA